MVGKHRGRGLGGVKLLGRGGLVVGKSRGADVFWLGAVDDVIARHDLGVKEGQLIVGNSGATGCLDRESRTNWLACLERVGVVNAGGHGKTVKPNSRLGMVRQ